jgi:hypothetical protein
MPSRPIRQAWRKMVGVLAEDDADPPLAQQPRQPLLAVAERQPTQIDAVQLQKVECVQHRLGDGAAAVERIKDRDRIRDADSIRPMHLRQEAVIAHLRVAFLAESGRVCAL